MTGGWQTSKEPTYVEACRAREGTDWYINRARPRQHGQDADRIKRLAADMGQAAPKRHHSRTRELPGSEYGTGFDPHRREPTARAATPHASPA